jgi:hypothetical protein
VGNLNCRVFSRVYIIPDNTADQSQIAGTADTTTLSWNLFRVTDVSIRAISEYRIVNYRSCAAVAGDSPTSSWAIQADCFIGRDTIVDQK